MYNIDSVTVEMQMEMEMQAHESISMLIHLRSAFKRVKACTTVYTIQLMMTMALKMITIIFIIMCAMRSSIDANVEI